MYVAPIAPHEPSIPHDDYKDVEVAPLEESPAFFEDVSDKPTYVADSQRKPERVREKRERMIRTLYSVDDLVGDLFDELAESGELKDTLAIYLSDNGWLWGEHGMVGKRVPYTDSVSIPFLMRWSGHTSPGIVDDRLIGTIDITPTILDAAGVTPSHQPDGHSLLDSFERDRLLLEHWDRAARNTPNWASLVTDTYQYVEHYLEDRFVVTYAEYYDEESDPWQLNNLLGDPDPLNNPNVSDISVRLLTDIRCEGTTGPNPCP